MQKIIVAAASVKNEFGNTVKNVKGMIPWIESAKSKGADLILFPELNVTGYICAPIAAEIAEPVPGPSTDRIISIAHEFNILIAFGIIERKDRFLYCSQVLVNSEGIIGKQRKIHVPAHEKPYWHAGDSIEVFDVGKVKVGISICRDSFFDEYTRTLYFKGAELVLMPFTYYNVPRSDYLTGTIHGMSLQKASWTNGYYSLCCNSAEGREPNQWEPKGRRFPGWAGLIGPWGNIISFVNEPGNNEALVVEVLNQDDVANRRNHPNFLAEELRPELYAYKS